jgi:hypothetical protein
MPSLVPDHDTYPKTRVGLPSAPDRREDGSCPTARKDTFAELREMGVRGVVIFYQDYRCSQSQAISVEQWADDVWLYEQAATTELVYRFNWGGPGVVAKY